MNLAPNGKPTNLTPEQYKLVRTKAFKDWFGDWENSPETASKVVDKNGEPLVVYRGSKTKNPNYTPHIHISGGIFFSTNKEVAKLYTESVWQNWIGRVFDCFLNIKKIENFNTLNFKTNTYQGDFKFYDSLVLKSKQKFNGLKWENIIDVPNLDVIYPKEPNDFIATTYVAFEPTQIKLADGSNTTFDGGNDDIRYADGGNISKENKIIYNKWKGLVNMTSSELQNFLNTKEGKEAGLSKEKADRLGIHYGRESAKWILKMKDTNVADWTPAMWKWANRQISFISRMKGNKGDLYDSKGNKTRKHTSLLIWGHNPKKYKAGANININKTMNSKKIVKVMREFKEGKLYSSSGDKVTDRKQAMAIAISEAKSSKMAQGGNADESYIAVKPHGEDTSKLEKYLSKNKFKITHSNSELHVLIESNSEKKIEALRDYLRSNAWAFYVIGHYKFGGRIKKTNNGKNGGLVGGKKHSKGGVKTVVVDDGRQVEIEAGEVIITAPAVKKHWKELDAINQDGGGVPIHAPEMKKGGNADSKTHWYDGGDWLNDF